MLGDIASTLGQLTSTFGNIPNIIQTGVDNLADDARNAFTSNNSTGGSDYRAKLDALHPDDVYANANGILTPLKETRGVIFPYSPTISFSQAVNYTDLQLVHSNLDYPSYTRTPTCTLQISGKFTVQNKREGRYALAVIHFLRAVSKSYFGEADAAVGKAGLPPPVLVFSAYGPYIYNRLRCVLKTHSWAYDDATDTVPIAVDGGATVRLPALFTVSLELMVVQTPYNMRTQFSFDQFASGALLNNQGGYV
jgi:hypothetical protein